MEHQEWFDKTMVHPLGATVLAILALVIFLGKRKAAPVAIFLAACVCARQRVNIATIDFDFLRILILVGWARVLLRRENAKLRLKSMDWSLIAFVVVGTAAYAIQRDFQVKDIIFRLGWAFDSLMMYFLFRCLFQTREDVHTFIKAAAITAVPVAVIFIVEKATSRNLFSVLGGVPAVTIMRDGKLRCQGAFAHPILAGCFWVTLLPLFWAQFSLGAAAKRRAWLGIAASGWIIFACASSTPVAAIAVVVFGLAMFALREKVKTIVWATVALLAFLHMVMKAPVWHLVSRIDIVGGSTGWQRYKLIDAFMEHYHEWFMFGTPKTWHWGNSMYDLTNQYVLEGVRGGFATMMLFILTLFLAYRACGRIWRNGMPYKDRVHLGWALGVALFTHCVIFIAVSYFAQILIVWYVLLAMIGSMDTLPPSAPTMAPGGGRLRGGQRPQPRAARRPALPRTATNPPNSPLEPDSRGVR